MFYLALYAIGATGGLIVSAVILATVLNKKDHENDKESSDN